MEWGDLVVILLGMWRQSNSFWCQNGSFLSFRYFYYCWYFTFLMCNALFEITKEAVCFQGKQSSGGIGPCFHLRMAESRCIAVLNITKCLLGTELWCGVCRSNLLHCYQKTNYPKWSSVNLQWGQWIYATYLYLCYDFFRGRKYAVK